MHIIKLLSLVLLALGAQEAFGSESCGIVNGVTVCTTESGCGIVNGETICAAPEGCGYVNGIYTCASDSGSDHSFTKTPAATGSKSTMKPGVYDAAIKDSGNWLATWASSLTTSDETGPLARFGRWLIQKAVVGYIELKIAGLKNAWAVAKGVLGELHVFDAIQNAWSGLGASAISMLNYFGIPAALNILLNAAATRYVFKFLPSF